MKKIAATLLAIPLLVAPPGAQAEKPREVLRWFGDASSATGNALGQGTCDLDGDGFDDAVVGSWFWDKGATANVGATYVLFGGPSAAGGDLNVPNAAGAARIDGPSSGGAVTGFSVACAGDVNGDAIDDLGISYYVEEKAYIVLGAEEFGALDLDLLGDRGFEVKGGDPAAFSWNVGNNLSAAGDVNGDGLGDVAVGAIAADTRGRANNGRIWIVAGKEDVSDVELVDPAGATPADGEVLAVLDGAGDGDRLGQGGLSPAGDVNGDGIEDFVTGAYAATPRATDTAVPGAAWVVWGDPAWGEGGAATEIDTATIGDAGFEVLGPARQRDRLGTSVSAAGDVNGDGFEDVIIGGDGVFNAATGQRPGSAWVVFGSDSSVPVWTQTDPTAPAAVHTCADGDPAGACAAADVVPRGYWIKGEDSDPASNASESTGFSLDGVGDLNGDAIPDFAIGAWGYDPFDPANPGTRMTTAGAVWVVYGRATTATQDLAALTDAEGYRIDGLAPGDRFGRSVAALGDFDGNGRNDFAAGADFADRPLGPGTPRDQAGEVMVALVGPALVGPARAEPSPGTPSPAAGTVPTIERDRKRIRPTKRRFKLPLSVACGSAGGCSLAIDAVRVRIAGERYGAKATAPELIGLGEKPPIAVRLSRKARRALREAGAGRLRVTLTISSESGTVTRTLRFKLSGGAG